MKILDKIAYDVAGISSLTVRAKDAAFHEYTLEAAVIKKLLEKVYKIGMKNGKVLVINGLAKSTCYDNSSEFESLT